MAEDCIQYTFDDGPRGGPETRSLNAAISGRLLICDEERIHD